MRQTQAMIQVAMALLEQPHERQWGYDLSRRAGVRSGVLYPMLTRMLEEGWLVDGWEDGVEARGKRPPRRYYELTEKGIQEMGGRVRAALADSRFTGLQRRFT